MSSTKEVNDFLTSRRARITPAMAGLPDIGEQRRVPGLRRSEVAALAGVSLEYYTRLERGNIRGASDGVLNALAAALQLNDVERAHLIDLARPTPPTASTSPPEDPPTEAPRGSAPQRPPVRASVQRVLDNLAVPAIVYNAHHDLVAANFPGKALYSQHFELVRPNLARFTFCDPRAEHFHGDWADARRYSAAMLRLVAGRDPLNPQLTALIGELSTLSPHFRTDWAQQDVHEHRSGSTVFRHPQVGELEFSYDVFELPGEPGLSIKAYSFDDASPTAERMALLTSWYATRIAEQVNPVK